jgi:hypothetical protein
MNYLGMSSYGDYNNEKESETPKTPAMLGIHAHVEC